MKPLLPEKEVSKLESKAIPKFGFERYLIIR